MGSLNLLGIELSILKKILHPVLLARVLEILLVLFIARLLGLCLLKPVDELLHLLHEDGPTLGDVAVLVPLEDHLLAEHLGLVEQEDDLVAALEEVLVVVAILLDLVAQNHLAFGRVGECREQGNVLF